jgi:hypothetical protein
VIPFRESDIARETVRKTQQMFSSFVGPGLHITYAALEAASGIPKQTLRDIAGGSQITFAQIAALRPHLPRAAINMITEVANAHLVDAEREESNWHGLAAKAAGLVSEVCVAASDGHIDHQERASLQRRTRDLIAEAQHMVEDG